MDIGIHTLLSAINLVHECKSKWMKLLIEFEPKLIEISPSHNIKGHEKIDCPLCYTKMLGLIIVTEERDHLEPIVFCKERKFTLNDYLFNHAFSEAVLLQQLDYDEIMELTQDQYLNLPINPIGIEIKLPDKLYGIRFQPLNLIQEYLGQQHCGIKVVLGKL